MRQLNLHQNYNNLIYIVVLLLIWAVVLRVY